MRICRSGLVLALTIASGCSRYPTRSDVDRLFAELPSQGPQARTSALGGLLDRLRRTRSAEDDAVERYALAILETAFASTKDRALLEVLDRTRLDGGFANDACGTYVRILKHPEARERYAAQDAPVARCIGITYSDTELRTLLQESGPSDSGPKNMR